VDNVDKSKITICTLLKLHQTSVEKRPRSLCTGCA